MHYLAQAPMSSSPHGGRRWVAELIAVALAVALGAEAINAATAPLAPHFRP